jgi:benzil reductase ((S)-benzoin forming)
MKKVIIISGANKGLGKAIADKYLLETDVRVISLSRFLSDDHADSVEAGKLLFIQVDLKEKNIESKLEVVKEFIGSDERIVFVSNAGTIDPIRAIGVFNDNEIADMVAVNVIAPVVITNYLMKYFGNRNLDFVNISSGAATRPIENWSLYCSAKAFVKMFFQIFKEEQKESGNIRTFTIDPGVMDTGMQAIIRGSGFPEKKDFQRLKDEGKLKTSQEAASEVIKMIQ